MRRKARARRRLHAADARDREFALDLAERDAEMAERLVAEQRKEELRRAAVNERLDKLRIEHYARKALATELARAQTVNVHTELKSATELIDLELDPPTPIVEELHLNGSNTLLAAQHKTGKTTLELHLAKSLADGEPFLGRFDTDLPGKVCILNYEMSERQFIDWLGRTGVENTDRILALNLRGQSLPFWEYEQMEALAEELFFQEVGFLIIDPAARAWRGLVESENDNVQLAEFFGAIDELKRAADIPNLLLATHTPRSSDDRARGGGEVEAWPDVNWYLAKAEGGQRTFRADGRDVLLPKKHLSFDEDTLGLTLGNSLRESIEQEIMAVMEANGGTFDGKSALLRKVQKGSASYREKVLAELLDEGRIVESKTGAGMSKKLSLG